MHPSIYQGSIFKQEVCGRLHTLSVHFTTVTSECYFYHPISQSIGCQKDACHSPLKCVRGIINQSTCSSVADLVICGFLWIIIAPLRSCSRFFSRTPGLSTLSIGSSFTWFEMHEHARALTIFLENELIIVSFYYLTLLFETCIILVLYHFTT